jgi:iron complex transport system substrate-binding protein
MPLRALLVIALALAAGGCGFKHEPTGALPAFPQTVRDALGREVVVDTAPKRIVSLDPGMSSAMPSIGATKLLVGRSGKETYPQSIMKVPVMVTDDGRPDVPALRKAEPDVILAPASMLPTKERVNALQLKVGAVVYVVAGDSVSGVEDDITSLGLITDRSDQARRVAGNIERQVAAVQQAVQGQPQVKTFVDVGFFFTIEPASMPADLIRLAGGTNVAAEADTSQRLSASQLRELAPEAWISVKGQGANQKQLQGRKSTASIPAVQQGNVTELPQSTLYDDGPRVGLSLAAVARALHPDVTISQ